MSEFKCAFCKHHIKGEPLWFKAAPTHPNESGCIEAMGAALATTERELVEVEALLGLAMKIGDATCWPLRSERDYYRRLAEERGRAYLHTLAERDEAHAAGRAAGLREGFDIARDHAWISTHDGWNRTASCIDWEHAEKRLAAALAPPAAAMVTCARCGCSGESPEGGHERKVWNPRKWPDPPVCADCNGSGQVTPAEPRDEGEVSGG